MREIGNGRERGVGRDVEVLQTSEAGDAGAERAREAVVLEREAL